MSHTLMAVLGSLMVDSSLRKTLVSSKKDERLAALKQRGVFLSCAEVDVFECMMKSFASGKLDEACNRIQSECPDWPCTHFTIA